MIKIAKLLPCSRIMRPIRPLRTVRAFAVPSIDLVEVSYYVGKSITLFVGFYCALQWLHYKDLLKQLEENDNDKKKDDKKN